jgi:hypothetical protein
MAEDDFRSAIRLYEPRCSPLGGSTRPTLIGLWLPIRCVLAAVRQTIIDPVDPVALRTAKLSGFVVSMFLMLLLCDAVGLTAAMVIPIATVLLFACNDRGPICSSPARVRRAAGVPG